MCCITNFKVIFTMKKTSLPKEYLYFTGDGAHNYFTTEWQGGQTWDWSLESPYEG